MKKYILDCGTIATDSEFWDLYLNAVRVVGGSSFGRNLDAFWDAMVAGGPGSPGECEIELVNTQRLAAHRSGNFYKSLYRIAERLNANFREGQAKLIVPRPAGTSTWKFWARS